jgi:hypothetical protein
MKNNHVIPLYLSDEEMEQLKKLEEKGERRQELFRSHLRTMYLKYYPPYAANKKREEEEIKAKMTPEQYCERIMGGTVEGEYCIIPHPNPNSGWEPARFKLTEVKDFGKDDLPW